MIVHDGGPADHPDGPFCFRYYGTVTKDGIGVFPHRTIPDDLRGFKYQKRSILNFQAVFLEGYGIDTDIDMILLGGETIAAGRAEVEHHHVEVMSEPSYWEGMVSLLGRTGVLVVRGEFTGGELKGF